MPPRKTHDGFCIKATDPRGVIHYVGTSGHLLDIADIRRGLGCEQADTWETRLKADVAAWDYRQPEWKIEVVPY